jgi:hypothetical protein
MESNWAAEHLQVIRTLMERAAIYRRALAPVMSFNGALGLVGAALGYGLGVGSVQAFILYWACVAALALAGSFFLVRRQALKDAEPFWSPPTRRVTQAILPGLVAGFIISVASLVNRPFATAGPPSSALLWLPLSWVILYGCAFHAAGFFMPRGMRLFGWVLILGGSGLLLIGLPDGTELRGYAHGIMGFFFGLLHLAYGVYLYFTEQRKNAA